MALALRPVMLLGWTLYSSEKKRLFIVWKTATEIRRQSIADVLAFDIVLGIVLKDSRRHFQRAAFASAEVTFERRK